MNAYNYIIRTAIGCYKVERVCVWANTEDEANEKVVDYGVPVRGLTKQKPDDIAVLSKGLDNSDTPLYTFGNRPIVKIERNYGVTKEEIFNTNEI